MTPTNPNRFLYGLSDVSQIVDRHCASPIIVSPRQPTVTVNTCPPPSGGGGGGSSDTWIELEFTASQTGPQTTTLTHTVSSGYFLFVNGLKQSRTAFGIDNLVLTLSSDLNIHVGDLVCFSYSTTDTV